MKGREPSKYANQNSKMNTEKRPSGKAQRELTLRAEEANTAKACINVNHIGNREVRTAFGGR